MGGDWMIDDHNAKMQIAAIAQEWGIDPQLLEEIEDQWELLTNSGNDDMIYNYYVQFDQDVDRETLTKLGLAPGEYYRDVSLNAFDQPDYEDE